MGAVDEDLELLKRLMEAGQFPGRNPVLSARGAASVALTLMCGVPITALAALTRAQWRPEGHDAVVVDPPGQYRDLQASKFRAVPLLGTAKTVVERYLALAGPGGPETPLLQAEKGGSCAHNAIDGAFDKAARRLGRPGLKLGRVRALFITRVEEADRDRDGMAEYLTGQDRIARAPGGWSAEDPPPEAAMRALLARAFPFHEPWRLLTHGGGGRGVKIEKTAPRMNRKRGVA